MFNSIINFFKGLFSKKTVDGINHALNVAAPYVAVALPIVEQIIRLTPTRSDDEVLRVLKHFGLLDVFDLGASKDRSVILRDVAVEVVRSKVKDPVKTHLLNTAVEIAYASLRVHA